MATPMLAKCINIYMAYFIIYSLILFGWVYLYPKRMYDFLKYHIFQDAAIFLHDKLNKPMKISSFKLSHIYIYIYIYP